MTETPRAAEPYKSFRLDVADARRKGFRIFRAWRSCGCCEVDMAFSDMENLKREFDPLTARFADTVRDDMGNVYQAVNTGRGYAERVETNKPNKRAIPVLPVLVLREQGSPRPHKRTPIL